MHAKIQQHCICPAEETFRGVDRLLYRNCGSKICEIKRYGVENKSLHFLKCTLAVCQALSRAVSHFFISLIFRSCNSAVSATMLYSHAVESATQQQQQQQH